MIKEKRYYFHADKLTLAEALRNELGVHPFTVKELRKVCEKDNVKKTTDFSLRFMYEILNNRWFSQDTCHCTESEDLAFALRKILETEAFSACGWVLVGKNNS